MKENSMESSRSETRRFIICGDKVRMDKVRIRVKLCI